VVLRNELSRIGLRPDGLIPIPGKASALCDMVLDAGGGHFTDVANMDVVESLKGKTVSLSLFTINRTNRPIRVGHSKVEPV